MKDTKEKFLEQLNSFVNPSMIEVAANLTKIGKQRKGNFMNQHAFKGEVTFEEVCHIRPGIPKFEPGTLLTSPEGIEEVDDELAMGLKYADSNMEAYIDLGIVKDIYELGERRRYLKAETIMVTDESIQIRKHTTIEAAHDLNKSGNKLSVVYTVRHVLHALDNKRKITIPTTMFKSDDSSRFSSDLTMRDNFDHDMVMTIYNTSKPEDVVKPLTIFKK